MCCFRCGLAGSWFRVVGFAVLWLNWFFGLPVGLLICCIVWFWRMCCWWLEVSL